MSGIDLQVLLGDVPVARIQGPSNDPSLVWEPDWLATGFPLSPCLPWGAKTYPVGATLRNFFENMLPEGSAFENLLDYAQVSRSNVLALALRLGVDLPGAVRLRTAGSVESESVAAFRPIAESELEDRVRRMAQVPIDIWDGRPRLSVAGMQPKLNLLEMNGELGLCEGNRLVSDRILKFSPQKSPTLLLNECMTMRLAESTGWDVAQVRLRRIGSVRALEVIRFDRRLVVDAEGPRVLRTHVIDGCQALGLPSRFKYERNFGDGRDVRHIRDGVSFGKLFALKSFAAYPDDFVENIFDWMLFTVIIGNSDAHGKNISFFMGSQGLEPTPWYDLIAVALLPGLEHSLAMAVSDVFDLDGLHALQVLETADELGRPRTWAQRRLERMLNRLSSALPNAVDGVESDGAEEAGFKRTWREFIEKRIDYWRGECRIMPEITI